MRKYEWKTDISEFKFHDNNPTLQIEALTSMIKKRKIIEVDFYVTELLFSDGKIVRFNMNTVQKYIPDIFEYLTLKMKQDIYDYYCELLKENKIHKLIINDVGLKYDKQLTSINKIVKDHNNHEYYEIIINIGLDKENGYEIVKKIINETLYNKQYEERSVSVPSYNSIVMEYLSGYKIICNGIQIEIHGENLVSLFKKDEIIERGKKHVKCDNGKNG